MNVIQLTDRLGIELPIIQAPMGGGPTTPQLVAAVSVAGGLGSLAGGYLTADQLERDITAVRERTDRPFAVNVFAPGQAATADEAHIAAARDRLAPLRAELGVADSEPEQASPPAFDEQVEVLHRQRPTVVSFTFGTLPADAVAALHDAGSTLIGTATTPDEAVVLAETGTDIICAQGAEAGAHRGSFLPGAAGSLITTLVLVPRICDTVDLPVIAAGGIMDGRALAAALALGACAGQLGTAYLRCPEAGTHPVHRAALRDARTDETCVTDAITGRAARTIRNRLAIHLQGLTPPTYPTMHRLTTPVRTAAAAAGRSDLYACWAGQGVAAGTELPAGLLTQTIARDAAARLRGLAWPPTDPEDDRA